MQTRIVSKPLLAAVAVVGAYAALLSDTPPRFSLDIPSGFNTSVTTRNFRKGEDLLHDQIYHLITVAPMTEYHGWFGPRVADQAHLHGWSVHVYARFNQKVAAAYAAAKDGYEADLNEEPEFLSAGDRSYMFARFERKHFRWGNGVSFFSQFTQDTGMYVPHNGHLQYEIWGTTPDQRYTIVASISVSHPKLANWGPEVRDARNMEALKNDRDYKLVETCSPDEFEPGLTAFDRVVDSVRIE
jgi:hypothetical protein